eukprot:m.13860 g.13860  ORF g.13860 m.13860 type:complete len:57 (+) comp25268_c0_seq2:182-352(+)
MPEGMLIEVGTGGKAQTDHPSKFVAAVAAETEAFAAISSDLGSCHQDQGQSQEWTD